MPDRRSLINDSFARLSQSQTGRALLSYATENETPVMFLSSPSYEGATGIGLDDGSVVFNPDRFDGPDGGDRFLAAFTKTLRQYYQETAAPEPKGGGRMPSEKLVANRVAEADRMTQLTVIASELAAKGDNGLAAQLPPDMMHRFEETRQSPYAMGKLEFPMKMTFEQWFSKKDRVEKTDIPLLDRLEKETLPALKEKTDSLMKEPGFNDLPVSERQKKLEQKGVDIPFLTPKDKSPVLRGTKRLSSLAASVAGNSYLRDWEANPTLQDQNKQICFDMAHTPAVKELVERLDGLCKDINHAVIGQAQEKEEVAAKEDALRRHRMEAKLHKMAAKAFDIMSKTPTGKAVTDKARELGFHVSIDWTLPPSEAGRCQTDEDADSFAVTFNPKIVKDTEDMDEFGRFFEVYAHEMTHGIAGPDVGKNKFLLKKDPKENLFMHRANESFAVSHSIQISHEAHQAGLSSDAWEFITGKAYEDPETASKYRFPYRDAAKSYRNSIEQAPENAANGVALRDAFMARFYKEERPNRIYMNEGLKTTEDALKEALVSIKSAETKEETVNEIKETPFLLKEERVNSEELNAFQKHLPYDYLSKADRSHLVLSNRLEKIYAPEDKERLRQINKDMANLAKAAGHLREEGKSPTLLDKVKYKYGRYVLDR